MLDTLPAEIIRIIVYELSIEGCADPENEEMCAGLRPVLGVNDKSYTGFTSWNFLVDSQDLLNLAHTCRHLKSVVYPVLFKTITCSDSSNMKSREHGYLNAIVFQAKREDEYNMALSEKSAPQFYHVANYTSLSKDVLRLVQRLYVNGFCPPHKSWFSNIVSNMTSLKDVMLFLTIRPKVHDLAHVFSSILKHKNSPCVHAHFSFNSHIP